MRFFPPSIADNPGQLASGARIFSWLILLLPALALTTPVGPGVIEFAILLGTIVYAKPLWRHARELFGSTRLIVLAFALNLAIVVVSLLWFGFRAEFLDNPLRQLLAVPVIGLIVLTRPEAKLFWHGVFVGAIGAAVLAIYQRFGLAMPRAEGFHMAIMFGDIAIAIGLMALASVPLFAKTRLAIVPYIAFLAGLSASILSGSRGGWVALVFSFVPLYSYGNRATRRGIIAIAALSVMLFTAAFFIPEANVRQRFEVVSTDIQQYQQGQVNTSIGTRLEMWRGAWMMFTEHPLAGVGRTNYHQELLALIARGKIDPAVHDYYHAHNELLHALATGGIIGALVLILLYAAPLAFFMRSLHRHDASQPYALAGLLLVLSFIDFGLTQVLFSHHIGTGFYAVTVSVLAGLCVMMQRKDHPA